MPGKDNTGPMGQGARTGNGRCFCNHAPINPRGREVRSGFGHCLSGGAKLGIGLGIGYGCRRLHVRRNQAPTNREVLEKQQLLLKDQLEDVTERLNRLSKANE